jgi:hypothetical protein
LKGRDHLEDIHIDGRIILKWFLNNVWTRFMWLRIGISEHYNKPIGSIKDR